MEEVKEKKNIRSMIKKCYFWFKDWEQLVNLTSGFMLILAFVIIIPQMVEMQMAWLTVFLILVIAINISFKKIERVFPDLDEEYNFNEVIKNIEGRLKKIEDGNKKNK